MGDNKTATGEFYRKPPNLGKWDSFKLFLWNPDAKTFLDRTAGSWGKSKKNSTNYFKDFCKFPIIEKKKTATAEI